MKTLPVMVIVCVVMTLTGADENRLIKKNCRDWFEYNGRCFTFIPNNMSWTKAEKNCQSKGGNLASIHNGFEYHEVQRMINMSANGYPETWIGGSDAQENGSWLWSDGTSFSYTNWAGDHPSPHNGQHCIQMNYGEKKRWDDVQCNVKRPSVCAKKI